jgi:hypothetical protein
MPTHTLTSSPVQRTITSASQPAIGRRQVSFVEVTSASRIRRPSSRASSTAWSSHPHMRDPAHDSPVSYTDEATKRTNERTKGTVGWSVSDCAQVVGQAMSQTDNEDPTPPSIKVCEEVNKDVWLTQNAMSTSCDNARAPCKLVSRSIDRFVWRMPCKRRRERSTTGACGCVDGALERVKRTRRHEARAAGEEGGSRPNHVHPLLDRAHSCDGMCMRCALSLSLSSLFRSFPALRVTAAFCSSVSPTSAIERALVRRNGCRSATPISAHGGTGASARGSAVRETIATGCGRREAAG